MNIQHPALGALLCIGAAAGVHAQTKADASDVRVKLIGCIQRSPAGGRPMRQPRP